MAWTFGAANTNVLNYGSTDFCNDTGLISIFVRLLVATVATTERYLFVQKGTENIGYFWVEFEAGATNRITVGAQQDDLEFKIAGWITGWPANSVHSIIGAYDGANLDIYTDGDPASKGTTTLTSRRTMISPTCTIGNGSGGENSLSASSTICEVGIWPRLLTPLERHILFATNCPLSVAGASSYWSLSDLLAADHVRQISATVTGAVPVNHLPVVVTPWMIADPLPKLGFFAAAAGGAGAVRPRMRALLGVGR